MKPNLIIAYLIYLLINSLFIVKYASRLNQFSEYMVISLYTVMLSLFIFLYFKFDFKTFYKNTFIIVFFIFFVFTIYINIKVDGNTLNVDRWSAMEGAIKALLNGEYPYSAIDHLGGRTSNLPSLIFIGIPFYIIGNIGLLQSFAFILFTYVLYITFNNYRDRLLCLLLLILSPSYIWEVYAKSDLMSNFIFILLFLVIIQIKFSKKIKLNVVFLSFLATALVLTRLTTVIPISLLLFSQFYKYTLKEKTLFIITALVTATLFLGICFFNVGSVEHFKLHNPFELQNRQLPMLVSLITILLPLIYSFRVKNLTSLMKFSSFFLFLPIFIALIINIMKNGLSESIIDSSFDISYLNIGLPFLLIYIVLENKNLLRTTENCNSDIKSIENV